MSYIPKTWAARDLITAESMNHIENGIAEAEAAAGSGSILLMTGTLNSGETSGATDCMMEDVVDAWMAGKRVVLYVQDTRDYYELIYYSQANFVFYSAVIPDIGYCTVYEAEEFGQAWFELPSAESNETPEEPDEEETPFDVEGE